MSSWEVVPCLLVGRNEFNLVSPKRDKGSDGTIGDANHSPGSDHTPDEDSAVLRDHDADHKNEVHALDIDSTGPWPDGKRGDVAGSWFDNKIKAIIATQKARWLSKTDMCALHYIIWRGMIYSTSTDWEGRTYTGSSDKHFGHVHFSARYETRAESDTRTWGVYVPPTPAKDDLPVDQKTFNSLMNGWVATPEGGQALLNALLRSKTNSPAWPSRTLGNYINDTHGVRDFLIGDEKGAEPKYSGVKPESPLGEMSSMPADIDKLVADLENPSA